MKNFLLLGLVVTASVLFILGAIIVFMKGDRKFAGELLVIGMFGLLSCWWLMSRH